MPEARPEHNNEQPAQVQEPAKMPAPPERKPAAGRGTPGHGGAFAELRGLLASGDGQEPPPERFAPIFRSAEIAAPVNEAQKARALGVLQQQFGNRYVQRVLAPAAPAQPGALVQRQANPAAPESAGAATIPTSAGQPLDHGTQNQMGARFGQDFGGVRVHTDSQAHQAARNLGAEAFTTGRDIYFSRGAYDPGSEGGRGLLAHELTHVVQQDRGAAGAAPQGFHVSQPDDPLEREAESVSAAVMRGELFPPIAAAPPLVQRQADAAPPRSAPAPTPAAGPGAQPAEARPGDYPVMIAGMPIMLPIGKLIDRAAPGGKLAVPDNILKRVPAIPAFKLTDASIDLDENKMPAGASISAALNIAPVEGQGTLTVDRQGNATGAIRAVFRSTKIPGLKETEIDARVGKDDFAFDAGIEFDFPKISGRLDYKYQGKKHSGKGKASYEGAKLKGTIEIILSEAGLLSGSGQLEMELFKGLRGMIDVDVDEKRNVKVKGKLQVPGQIELFPEKKYEKSFFNFEKKFPLWGITVPVVDINVGLFAEVHAGAGFRSKFGPGVLRNIELTGEFGSDPEAATELGLGGEFFVPAGAEIVINAGGGIGLGLAIADITGGIEAVGVAGLYAALTVRPQFKYSGGKYSISGMAELAGVAQAKFGINAFAKIDVGVWMFKGTVWRKDWTLAEWVWNMGLNVALRANINYTLGDDFAPDISFETGQVDPEKFVKDVMPESGSPVPAPPKPPVPDKGTFTAEGATGTQAGGAPAQAPAPPTPGTPAATTQPGQAPAGAGPAGAAPGAPGAQPPGSPTELTLESAANISKAVKQQTNKEIEQLPRIIDTSSQLLKNLHQIHNQHEKQGLKKIRVQSKGQRNEILSEASAAEFADYVEGFRQRSYGGCAILIQIDGQVVLDGEDALVVWNAGSGGPHAERKVRTKLLELMDQGKINRTTDLIEIWISFSPCTDSCRFVLRDIEEQIHREHQLVRFRWYYQDLYVSSRAGHTKEMAQKVVNEYRTHGIFIEQFDEALENNEV